jgi:hypothetical protein
MPILSIPLTAEEEAALTAQAKALGISVESLTRKAILQIIRSSSGNSLRPDLPLTAEEFDEAFDEIADMIPENLPPLSDTALGRENLYDGDD